MAYDVIVVGARVAGAATALLLARAGLRVLAIDRATFPSDTISSHQVQLPGIALLHRWGVLDRLVRAGTPATPRVRFDTGPVVLEGEFPVHDGVRALYSPRRTMLDTALIEAAREAGAEVLEGTRLTDLIVDGGAVRGVQGTRRGGVPWRATAPLVIGADGKHSAVAQRVGARVYRWRPVGAFACYGYVADLPVGLGEMYQRPGRAVAVFPTNDNLTMVYVAGPIREFAAFRRDITGSYLDSLDRCGDLGARVRAGRLVGHLRTTPDQPNLFRVPYGPGWALVGDAGVVMDSITAQASATLCATPTGWRRPSSPGSAAPARCRPRWPTITGAAMPGSVPSSTSLLASPDSAGCARSSGRSSRRSPIGRRRPSGSWPRSPASPRSIAICRWLPPPGCWWGRVGHHAGPRRPEPGRSMASTTCSAMARLEVAAGDGALRTAVTGPRRWMRKSSTRLPSRSSACARTPAPARTTSSGPMSGTYRLASRM
jgi:2-polyprenyl-6-methoxyphenol hydroxylase-like FAD-dependent oxidoreductase